jgi:two-component system, LytTR family, sensor kinase
MSEYRRFDSLVLWIVLAASLVLALLTLAGSRLALPEPLPPNAGPSYPRVPAPVQSAGELLRLMRIGSLTWYACILSAPLFMLLSRRLRFDRRGWPLSVAVFVAVTLLLVVGTATAQYHLTYRGAPLVPPLGAYLQVAVITSALPFIAVAAAAQAVVGTGRARARELEAARVRAQLVEARLEALTAQLQPHFLFNTLQSISAVIPHDAAAADRMLMQLSDLLREVLRRGERRLVTLAEELTVLEPYLEISRMRFGARLTIDVQVDADAARALVPFFLLQPLVENALQHGVGSRAGNATVRVRASRRGDRLGIVVADDGRGLMDGGDLGGIGLRNTRARLDELYGQDHSLELAPGSAGGLEVRVDLPFRAAPVVAA